MDQTILQLSFLDEAKAHIDETYDIQDILDSDIKSVAKSRINGIYDLQRPLQFKLDTDAYTTEEIALSYPLSRIIVSNIDNPILHHLYLLNESRRFVNAIKEDTESSGPLMSSDGTYSDVYTRLIGSSPADTNLQEQYNRIVPFELHQSNTNNSRSEMEVIKSILYWHITSKVAEDFPIELTSEISDEIDDITVDISQSIPTEFKISQRGLPIKTDQFDIHSIPQHFPPVYKPAFSKMVSQDPIAEIEQKAVLRLLLDLQFEVPEITAKLDAQSEWVDSYLQEELYDIQGDKKYESYGLYSPTVSDLHKNDVFIDSGLLVNISDHPAIYMYLKSIGQLYNFNMRS